MRAWTAPPARLGAVAFIHRFGSSLDGCLHFHRVVIDGMFDAAAHSPPGVPVRTTAHGQVTRQYVRLELAAM
jgi:hypothetical protein